MLISHCFDLVSLLWLTELYIYLNFWLVFHFWLLSDIFPEFALYSSSKLQPDLFLIWPAFWPGTQSSSFSLGAGLFCIVISDEVPLFQHLLAPLSYNARMTIHHQSDQFNQWYKRPWFYSALRCGSVWHGNYLILKVGQLNLTFRRVHFFPD